MLLLNEKDIKALARPEELIDVVEQAVTLYEKGNFEMPNRIGVPRGENTYLYMPCFTEAVHDTKALTLFPQNTARGLGRIQGLMLLNDPADRLGDRDSGRRGPHGLPHRRGGCGGHGPL